MSEERLDKTFDVLIENEVFDLELSPIIKENLKFQVRPYQVDAFSRCLFYIEKYKKRRKPTQLLFHMATGSGKTLIMAGAILELYRLGYRNFIFFVNTDTIIRKTKENFLNPNSSKYLFNNQININGQNILIREVSEFESANTDDINILFSTIQGLHTKLNNPQENSITFDDFQDDKVVLISDEAHHINTITKKKLTGDELEMSRSWENTVSRIFDSNPDNIMLEFTATLELTHPAVAAKYNNKLLVDYALAKFREDGYSKEVKTNQIDFETIDRAVIGIIISQFKKKVFSDNGLIIKPVVMMKSKTTADSALMEKLFVDTIKDLTPEKIDKFRTIQNPTIQAAFAYFDTLGLSSQNLADELKDDFSVDKIISINSKNDSDDKQIVINSLEDNDNEYRVVFAVDKLNEGWDVLNLFDIVRLYDTRDSKGGKPGNTTVQEAQLIGRGARYCPFKINSEQEIDKRKFDSDLTNQMRICETLHYHCSHNPRYIEELNNALKEIGIIPDEKVEVDLLLKNEFKETNLYKNGYFLVNRKVENDPQIFLEYQEPNIRKIHSYSLRTSESKESIIFENNQVEEGRPAYKANQEHLLSMWDVRIVKKAMDSIPFYHFDKLRKYFPSIKSIDDFISKPNYLGEIKVSVSGLAKDIKEITPQNKLIICKGILTDISNEIHTKFGDYRGTKSFYREPIRKHFKDKKLYFSLNKGVDAETGKPTMRHNIDEKYYVDLKQKDWYVFNENYGSSEEKFLVKFIDSQIEDLNKKYSEIYLLRNERFFKLFRFSDGKATEPDFVLFLTEKDADDSIIYQLFIEPKGQQLLETDKWKEDFLQEIESEATVELYQNEQFRLIGMPFFNNETTKKEVFKNKLQNL
jgi:type III restriction enzyme